MVLPNRAYVVLEPTVEGCKEHRQSWLTVGAPGPLCHQAAIELLARVHPFSRTVYRITSQPTNLPGHER
jgi:hypothetical protein